MSALGTARWYLDADTLGLAHILVRARPDVTFPGDDGARHKSRWTLPPCVVQDQATLDVDWIPAVTAAGLAILTRDNKILARRRELDTVLASRAKLFAISGAVPLSNWQQLEIAVRQWDAMEGRTTGGRPVCLPGLAVDDQPGRPWVTPGFGHGLCLGPQPCRWSPVACSDSTRPAGGGTW